MILPRIYGCNDAELQDRYYHLSISSCGRRGYSPALSAQLSLQYCSLDFSSNTPGLYSLLFDRLRSPMRGLRVSPLDACACFCGCRLRHVLLRNSRRAFTIAHRSRYSVRRVSHLCNSKSLTPISNLVLAGADSLYWTVNIRCASSPVVFLRNPCHHHENISQSSSLAPLERNR
jgi:hypothetical protein